jgi:hypothetical protein
MGIDRDENGVLDADQAAFECYANCDASTVAPVLNAGDFSCFLNRFRSAQLLPPDQQLTAYANCDGSTVAPVLNAGDFSCFLSRFRAGCN